MRLFFYAPFFASLPGRTWAAATFLRATAGKGKILRELRRGKDHACVVQRRKKICAGWPQRLLCSSSSSSETHKSRRLPCKGKGLENARKTRTGIVMFLPLNKTIPPTRSRIPKRSACFLEPCSGPLRLLKRRVGARNLRRSSGKAPASCCAQQGSSSALFGRKRNARPNVTSCRTIRRIWRRFCKS